MDFSSFKICLFSPLAVALWRVPAQTWHPHSVYQVLILERNFSLHQNIAEIKSKQTNIFGILLVLEIMQYSYKLKIQPGSLVPAILLKNIIFNVMVIDKTIDDINKEGWVVLILQNNLKGCIRLHCHGWCHHHHHQEHDSNLISHCNHCSDDSTVIY